MTLAEEIYAALSGANLIDEFEMLSPDEQVAYLMAIDQTPAGPKRAERIEDMCAALAAKGRP